MTRLWTLKTAKRLQGIIWGCCISCQFNHMIWTNWFTLFFPMCLLLVLSFEEELILRAWALLNGTLYCFSVLYAKFVSSLSLCFICKVFLFFIFYYIIFVQMSMKEDSDEVTTKTRILSLELLQVCLVITVKFVIY